MILTLRSLRIAVAPVVALAAAFVIPLAVEAQVPKRTGGPVAGTWGAEADVNTFGDASVLRFVSPSWAVLVGASGSTTSDYTSGTTRVDGQTTFSVNAGVRKYHGTGLGLRPITGAGINIVRFISSGSRPFLYGEAGAAYLFTPHVSIGAAARLGFSRDGNQNTFSLKVPRVMVSVYF